MVMGIYDRDYYRHDGPGFLDALTSHGRACNELILLKVMAFVLPLGTRYQDTGFEYGGALREPFTNFFILDVDAVMHGQVWRLLTYAFLHDTISPWHIVFNMLFLWWFGTDVEDV